MTPRATRYIAFLRAINVGGRVVKMDVLKRLFEELRFAHVETFIASGNVIFETTTRDVAALEARIAKHLERALGYPVGVFLRTVDELARISVHAPASHEPRGGVAPRMHVVFLTAEPPPEVAARLAAASTDDDELHLHGRELYWLCRTPMSDSPVGTELGKLVGVPNTARNVNTVRRLVAKYGRP